MASSGSAAAYFALAGALGAAAIAQAGQTWNAVVQRKHAERMTTLSAAREAFIRVATAVTRFGNRARSFHRLMQHGPPLDGPVREYLDDLRELANAVAAADLFVKTGSDLDIATDGLVQARRELAHWIAAHSDGRVVNLDPDPPKTSSFEAAMTNFDNAGDAYLVAAQKFLRL